MLGNHTRYHARYKVRLAQSAAEIRAAQELRYRVFVQEGGALVRKARVARAHVYSRREADIFDATCQHLIALDNKTGQVVGTYRLLPLQPAHKKHKIYTAQQYDIAPLLNSKKTLLELGRTCIDSNYRGGAVLHCLWAGLANYIRAQNTEVLFGVASFHGQEPKSFDHALSYLYHYHRADKNLTARARENPARHINYLPRNKINKTQALAQMPPLIKRYLAAGAQVGDYPFIDTAFNTIDVFMVLDIARLAARYDQRYLQNRAA